MIGDGEHIGKIRLVGQTGSATGGIKPANLKHSLRFNFGSVPRLGDEIFDKYEAEIKKIDQHTYEIEVGMLFENNEVKPDVTPLLRKTIGARGGN